MESGYLVKDLHSTRCIAIDAYTFRQYPSWIDGRGPRLSYGEYLSELVLGTDSKHVVLRLKLVDWLPIHTCPLKLVAHER